MSKNRCIWRKTWLCGFCVRYIIILWSGVRHDSWREQAGALFEPYEWKGFPREAVGMCNPFAAKEFIDTWC